MVIRSQEGGLEPDMSTYAGLLYSCGRGGLHKSAKIIHRHMLRSNVTPTSDGFTGEHRVIELNQDFFIVNIL